MSINAAVLENIEEFTNNQLKDTIDCLICCHSNTYKLQVIEKCFRFVPGHRALILQLPKYLEENRYKILNYARNHDASGSHFDAMVHSIKSMPALSNMLKELLLNAMKNFEQPQNQYNRYSEIMKYFSMHIYMICGKKCYEVLEANLKLPASSTISKYTTHN